LYAERLSVFLEACRSRLEGLLEIPDVEAGLQTISWLAPGIEAEHAASEAAKHQVEVIPLSRYSSRFHSKRQGLLLGFAAVDARELRRGAEQLARALEQCNK
jgi:GntR family transcriptional regulator / MocR family aminotransferase